VDRINTLVKNLNTTLVSGISGTCKAHGIVRVVEKGDEKINYDTENNPVVFDDKYSIFFYHKLLKEGFEVLQSRGKGYVYNVDSSIDLIVFCEKSAVYDYLISKLSTVRDLTISESDFDSYKILKEETSIVSYDFKKHIFKINYNLKYKSDECSQVNNC
jgi:hypothetical protein